MSRNICVVTADSLRADHCGWHEEATRDDLTPTLNALADDAISFTSAISPGPRTPSSIPVSHTGTPFPRGDYDVSNYGECVARIRDHIERFETISEWLQKQGYTTIAFTANPWTSAQTSFDAGFDEFVEFGKTGGRIHSVFSDTRFGHLGFRFDQWIHKNGPFSQWRTFYDDMLAAFDRADDPIFLWTFLLDSHNPYIVPRQDREETSAISMWSSMLKANKLPGHETREGTYRQELTSEDDAAQIQRAYRDCVRSVDAFVGRLLGDIGDAVLLFHSDHGEAFGEHGSYGHERVLYEENIHVPCLLYDGHTEAIVTDPVSTATIPKMLQTIVRDEEVSPEQWTAEYAVARTGDDASFALRGSRWKYIRTDDGEELYDLRTDPDETDDRSDRDSEVLEEFRSMWAAHVDSLPETISQSDPVENERMKEHLESLGYLEN